MVDPTEQADFFWRVCLPIALLAMVLFGFPWLGMRISEHRAGAQLDCMPVNPVAPEAEQVQGRAPGSSDHASPIRRTEARAERTLDPARTETASAREGGERFTPRAPEPSAARVG